MIAGLMASFLGVNALRDVPVGYCHDCEVSCFEDCSLKYDREITVPDNTGTDRLSRKDTRVEAHMKKKLHGVVLSQNGTADASKKNATLLKLTGAYKQCLKQDKCPCALDARRDAKAKKQASFLATAAGQKKCKISE